MFDFKDMPPRKVYKNKKLIGVAIAETADTECDRLILVKIIDKSHVTFQPWLGTHKTIVSKKYQTDDYYWIFPYDIESLDRNYSIEMSCYDVE